jgi:hypothetical protein
MKSAIIALTLLAFTPLAGVAAADTPATTSDPAAIMKAVHDRNAGDRMSARLRMTITGSGSARVRTMLMRSAKFVGGRKRVILFDGPADVRNTGLLTTDFDAGGREDDQWLYLPSLHQATRIATTRRSGSFVGSDFSFADLTLPEPARYRHRLLRQTDPLDGEDCWVIESIPIDDSLEAETGYLRAETWVAKSTLLPVRIKAAMRRERSKYIALGGVRVIQGIATPSTITARVVFEGKVESQTVLEQSDVRYDDPGVGDDEFTTQRLERGL